MSLILEEEQKYLQDFINDITYHPMNPDADVTYQTVNLFSSDKCFSASFLIVHITFDEISLQFQSTNISLLHMYRVHLSLPELHRQCCADLNYHNTVCTILVKIDVLNTCGAMICSYFGIVFLLLFKKIENAVYTCFQNSMLLFINGFIFDIMNIQNNHSLEFE